MGSTQQQLGTVGNHPSIPICHGSLIHTINNIQRLFLKATLDLVFLYLLYSTRCNSFYMMYSYDRQATYKGLMLVVFFFFNFSYIL